MKPLIPVLALAAMFAMQSCDTSSRRLASALQQLRECNDDFDPKLPMVGGSAVGSAATPHEFYLLFPYVSQIASDDDLKGMLKDKSAAVRIMAAKCILKKKYSPLSASVEALVTDRTPVAVAPFGCAITTQTVGEVVAELKKDPDFLGDPNETNRSLGQRDQAPSVGGGAKPRARIHDEAELYRVS